MSEKIDTLNVSRDVESEARRMGPTVRLPALGVLLARQLFPDLARPSDISALGDAVREGLEILETINGKVRQPVGNGLSPRERDAARAAARVAKREEESRRKEEARSLDAERKRLAAFDPSGREFNLYDGDPVEQALIYFAEICPDAVKRNTRKRFAVERARVGDQAFRMHLESIEGKRKEGQCMRNPIGLFIHFLEQTPTSQSPSLHGRAAT